MRTQLVMMLTISLLAAACERERVLEPQAVPVRTEVARRSDFAPSLTLLGVVRAASSVPLTLPVRGIVTFPPRFAGGLRTGERVRRGETVATIRNDAVVFAQTQARLQLDAATGEFERVKKGHDAGLVSAADFSAAQLRAALARETFAAASREAATLRLAAPADGTLVVSKPFAAGTSLDGGSVLAEIVTGAAPVVESNVAASERALLRPGLAVRFSGRGTPAWQGSGRITEVAAVVDAAGTARVVAAIDGGVQHPTPPPGSGIELKVELERRRDVLTVPEDALAGGSDGAALFIAGAAESRGAFRAKRIPVETGGRANGRVEITSGLHDGDRVIVTGGDALTDDSVVTEAKEP
jgi:multidrug efflux system membrane fusion protein